MLNNMFNSTFVPNFMALGRFIEWSIMRMFSEVKPA